MPTELQKKLKDELASKAIFEQAQSYAYDYIDQVTERSVFPGFDALKNLSDFAEELPRSIGNSAEILQQLHSIGSPGTIAQTGGRYFGFVNGGAIPVSLGVKWLADVWDQCAGLYLTSPVNAKLESVCENWLNDIFDLPSNTVAGFVSGTSMANLCALGAARYRLLERLGWNLHKEGLNGAPRLRIIAHEQIHASVTKTLAILGFGQKNMEWIPADDQGRLSLKDLPKLDETCLVLTQAGNVNSGAFDPFVKVCESARQVGAWVHVDGAFGLWAAACQSLKHLTAGMQLANSWAVDGHKTLNTPYDSGIVMCQDAEALVHAMQASGAYITYSDQRDPLLYGPELSKRARAIELWSVLKFLGREGIDQMISTMHAHAKTMAQALEQMGYRVLNEVVFNQVLIAASNDDQTEQVLKFVQSSGECWMGGSTWQNQKVIRLSISSWRTDENDVDRTLMVLKKALEVAA